MTTIETKTVEISFTIEVECEECNERLEAEFTERRGDYGRVTRTLSVIPCEKCLVKAKQEGHDDGLEDAKLEEGS